MKDLFKNYHKHKVLSNISIVGISLMLAISVNMLLVGSDTSKYLKASVLDANSSVTKADIEVVKSDSGISILSNAGMNNVTQISFSLAYDPKSITLKDVNTLGDGVELAKIENEAGYRNYLMSFNEAIDIEEAQSILTLAADKSIESSTYVNIINANFLDEAGETYLLTTGGLVY